MIVSELTQLSQTLETNLDGGVLPPYKDSASFCVGHMVWIITNGDANKIQTLGGVGGCGCTTGIWY